MGGGLLDKTDAAIKSELESLLPLQVWGELRCEAASLAATARDDGARLEGETRAAERAAATAATQMAAVRAFTLIPTLIPTLTPALTPTLTPTPTFTLTFTLIPTHTQPPTTRCVRSSRPGRRSGRGG
jgi:hypothetical protein